MRICVCGETEGKKRVLDEKKKRKVSGVDRIEGDSGRCHSKSATTHISPFLCSHHSRCTTHEHFLLRVTSLYSILCVEVSMVHAHRRAPPAFGNAEGIYEERNCSPRYYDSTFSSYLALHLRAWSIITVAKRTVTMESLSSHFHSPHVLGFILGCNDETDFFDK